MGVGVLVRSHWSSRNEPMPAVVAALMLVGLVGVFSVLFGIFHFNNPPGTTPDPTLVAQGESGITLFNAAEDRHDSRMRFGFWLGIFFLLPFGYYVWNFVDSFAARTVDRIGPMSGSISDPSEYAEARKLALKGDVDGAVALYRSYDASHEDALFEAARLLKGEHRYTEAAETLEEIAKRYYGKLRIWSDAVYQLAKLKEQHLNQPGEAMGHLQTLMQRSISGHYTELATGELLRMQQAYGDIGVTAAAEGGGDPFYDDEDVRGGTAPTAMGVEPMDSAVVVEEDDEEAGDSYPTVDPFFQARMKAQTGRLEPLAGKSKGARKKKASAKKKPAAKKKASAKKKAVVKKKAVAKKKTAAKKKATAKKKTAAKKKGASRKRRS